MRAPEPLTKTHVLTGFNSARASLNGWLIDRAMSNEEQGAIGHDAVSAKFKKNMPNPLPVTVLGRLAVDQSHAGRGIGIALLRDAVLRARLASVHAASRGIFVQALDEEAASFYLKFGFSRSPSEPLYLMLALT